MKRAFPWRWLFFGLVLVLLAGGGYAYSVYRGLENNITTQDFIEPSDAPRPTVAPEFEGALNILVMGSDTREGQKGVGIGGETPGLSDTTILLHVAKDRSFAYGVSLPRDAMVERPACPLKNGEGTDPGGLTQFNQAYAVGGPACTVLTVEQLTGIRVNHFAVVDFSGFQKLVDAVGGVEMCVPEEVNDTIGNIKLAKGTYTMDGQTALDYVRVRHGLGTDLGDLGRMKRRQAFVSALIGELTSSDTLTSPSKLMTVVKTGTSSLTTDPAFADLAKLGSLAKDLNSIGTDRIRFVTVPLTFWPEDPNRVIWTDDARAIWFKMQTDQPLGPRMLKEAIAPETPAKPLEMPSASPTPSATASASPKPAPPVGSAIDKSTYGLCG